MGDMTGLLLIGGLAVGAFLFKDDIAKAIDSLSTPPADPNAGAGTQPAADPNATATSTTNIIAPQPLGVGYPLVAPYPLGYPQIGYAPYGGYPWAWPPVIGHFSAPRWFNNYPRFPYGGYPYPYPRPHPGPRFLGPPVPAPFPGPHH